MPTKCSLWVEFAPSLRRWHLEHPINRIHRERSPDPEHLFATALFKSEIITRKERRPRVREPWNLYHALEDTKDSMMLHARPIEGLAWEVPARNWFNYENYELNMDEHGTSTSKRGGCWSPTLAVAPGGARLRPWLQTLTWDSSFRISHISPDSSLRTSSIRIPSRCPAHALKMKKNDNHQLQILANIVKPKDMQWHATAT